MKPVVRACSTFFCLMTVASAADYFPLAVGNKWSYSVTMDGLNGTLKQAIEQKIIIVTDTVFRVSDKIAVPGFNDSASGYMMSVANDAFSFENLSDVKPYDKIFEHAPSAGHTWTQSTGEIQTITYYGTYTVPAGTFNSCYAVVEGGDTIEIFAPDVGLIASDWNGTSVALSSYTVSPPSPVIVPFYRANGNKSTLVNSVHPGFYALIDAQGRAVDIVASNRYGKPDHTLPPGNYFLLDKDARASGTKGAIKMCVTGR